MEDKPKAAGEFKSEAAEKSQPKAAGESKAAGPSKPKAAPATAHVICEAPCPRVCLTGGLAAHSCRRRCGDSCGPCEVLVRRQLSSCSHTAELPCGLPVEDYECIEKCQRLLGRCNSYVHSTVLK